MNSHRVINIAIRYMEFLLKTIVTLSYISGIFMSIKTHSIFSGIFISFSFIQYCLLLIKPPGKALDRKETSVKGLCTSCSKIRGCRTKHCHICNTCFNRLDHHCIFIGKCITPNNLRNLFYCLFFNLLYLFTVFRITSFKPLLGFISLMIFTILVWLSLCIACDKTSREMFKNPILRLNKDHLLRYLNFIMGFEIKKMGVSGVDELQSELRTNT